MTLSRLKSSSICQRLFHEGNCDLVPGDIVEWAYKRDGSIVIEHDMLWSTPMNRWVPIGSGLVHTLVSIDGEQIMWLNREGCFHARVDDIMAARGVFSGLRVLPRAC